MKKPYYLFNPGRMSRRDHTLCFTPQENTGRAKYLPIAGIEALYIFGSIDANSALFTFLGKQGIPVHFFDYYEHYAGSFQPKDYLLAGSMQVAQSKAYLKKSTRVAIAKSLIRAASFNLLKNLRYYLNRDREVESQILQIESFRHEIDQVNSILELMGLEGNIRQTYYEALDHILLNHHMGGRQKQPPGNEANALMSFGNMMCYSLCLDMIYHTQLNPTISFLHEPGTRRYSLALDLAEVFKPILIDRLIFRLLNKQELRDQHFEKQGQACFLTDSGKKIFIQAFEQKLQETIQHRSLKRKVSYKRLVLLECYKLQKFILGIDESYKAFQIWW